MRHRHTRSDTFYTPNDERSEMLLCRFIHAGTLTARRPWSYDLHTHIGYECFLVTRGAVRTWIDGMAHTVRSGGMYFVMHGQTHREEGVKLPLSLRYCKFHLTDLKREPLFIIPKNSSERQCCRTPPALAELFNAMLAEVRGDQPGARGVADALTLALVWHLRRAVGAVPKDRHSLERTRIVEETISRIHRNIAAVSLHDLAAAAGVTSDHLGKMFKAYTGASPLSYAMKLRIEEAKRLLADEHRSVTETARMLGYSDVFHFSKKFKQFENVSPRAWLTHKDR